MKKLCSFVDILCEVFFRAVFRAVRTSHATIYAQNTAILAASTNRLKFVSGSWILCNTSGFMDVSALFWACMPPVEVGPRRLSESAMFSAVCGSTSPHPMLLSRWSEFGRFAETSSRCRHCAGVSFGYCEAMRAAAPLTYAVAKLVEAASVA